jgi:NadR type nicotinamide-nucleotide adenylyltransferase
MEKTIHKNGPLKKVAIIGPECTGKSWLSEKLAGHYQTVWVPEYARSYLDSIGRPYTRDDLTIIAKGQLMLEDDYATRANGLLFCDTNLWVVKVWSEHKYGSCDPWILDQIHERRYDVHFLSFIDIPWEADPQREHPHMRKYFYDVYFDELTRSGSVFYEIKGLHEKRLEQAINYLEPLFR